MDLIVNDSIRLKPIDRENAALLFPLFKADLKRYPNGFLLTRIISWNTTLLTLTKRSRRSMKPL